MLICSAPSFCSWLASTSRACSRAAHPRERARSRVRLSIGAGRARIVRQLLTESALLAVGGALAGAAVGYLGMLLWKQIPIEGDVAIELLFEMERRVLLVNLVVAVTSVFVFGLMPALRASRASLTDALRTTGADGRPVGLGTRSPRCGASRAVGGLHFHHGVHLCEFLELVAGPGVRTEGVLTMSFNTESRATGRSKRNGSTSGLPIERARSPASKPCRLRRSSRCRDSRGERLCPRGARVSVGIESEAIADELRGRRTSSGSWNPRHARTWIRNDGYRGRAACRRRQPGARGFVLAGWEPCGRRFRERR